MATALYYLDGSKKISYPDGSWEHYTKEGQKDSYAYFTDHSPPIPPAPPPNPYPPLTATQLKIQAIKDKLLANPTSNNTWIWNDQIAALGGTPVPYSDAFLQRANAGEWGSDVKAYFQDLATSRLGINDVSFQNPALLRPGITEAERQAYWDQKAQTQQALEELTASLPLLVVILALVVTAVKR